MPDLHERLKFAVDIRLIIARAATPGPWEYANVRGVTSIGAPYVLPSVAADVAHDADVHYLVAHDPTTMIRHYERDLRVLERHSKVSTRYSAPGRAWCCGCYQEAPCPDLSDLAAAYGVEVDGG